MLGKCIRLLKLTLATQLNRGDILAVTKAPPHRTRYADRLKTEGHQPGITGSMEFARKAQVPFWVQLSDDFPQPATSMMSLWLRHPSLRAGRGKELTQQVFTADPACSELKHSQGESVLHDSGKRGSSLEEFYTAQQKGETGKVFIMLQNPGGCLGLQISTNWK